MSLSLLRCLLQGNFCSGGAGRGWSAVIKANAPPQRQRSEPHKLSLAKQAQTGGATATGCWLLAASGEMWHMWQAKHWHTSKCLPRCIVVECDTLEQVRQRGRCLSCLLFSFGFFFRFFFLDSPPIWHVIDIYNAVTSLQLQLYLYLQQTAFRLPVQLAKGARAHKIKFLIVGALQNVSLFLSLSLFASF